MINYLNVINYGNRKLKANNIINYNLDSELLLAKVLNYKREKLLINLEKKIEIKKFNIFKKLVARRVKKEPIAYIFKQKEFWRDKFFVNSDVLIPITVQQSLTDALPSGRLKVLQSAFGHDGFLLEYEQITKEILEFYHA